METIDALWRKLRPLVIRAIDAKIAGAGAGSTLAHDIGGPLHTGTLLDSQGPNFLLRDGSRSLLGNLAVGAGVTIDGVDLDDFYDTYVQHTLAADAHHAGFVGLRDDSGAIVGPAGDDRITLDGGAGIATTAGTNLVTLALRRAANSGLSISGSDEVSVGQGAGLTVSGDAVALTTPGTLSVSSANTATGNHTHAITSSSNPGQAARLLATTAAGKLTLYDLALARALDWAGDTFLTRAAAQRLRLSSDVAGTLPAALSLLGYLGAGFDGAPAAPLHAIRQGEQLRLGYDATNYAAFTTNASGTLEIEPLGDLVLDPQGNAVLPALSYDVSLGSPTRKWLAIHGAELRIETLVAQDVIATIGGRVLVGPTTVLTADLSDVATSITVKHNEAAVGDVLYLESGGLVEFLQVTSGPTGSGPYTYGVTRNLDGTGANAWDRGSAVFNTGQAGDGWMDLYAMQGVGVLPFTAIFSFTNSGGSPYEIGTYSASKAELTQFDLFSATTQHSSVYIGLAGATFSDVRLLIDRPLVSSTPGTLVWEYWNGAAWASASAAVEGSLSSVGAYRASWGTLSGWATKTINGQSAYWVRARWSVAPTGVTQTPRHGGARAGRGKAGYGPTIAGNARLSSTFNDWAEHWAIGNLAGLYDYASSPATYGAAFGRYSPSHMWMSTDAANGIRMMRGVTRLGHWAPDGTVTVGEVGTGLPNVQITGADVNLRMNTITRLRLSAAGHIRQGSDVDTWSGTAFTVVGASGAVGEAGETLDTGDVLFGRNAAGYANALYDVSAGRINFRSGTTSNTYIDGGDGSLIGAGGRVKIRPNALELVNVSGSGTNASMIDFYRNDGATLIAYLRTGWLQGGGSQHQLRLEVQPTPETNSPGAILLAALDGLSGAGGALSVGQGGASVTGALRVSQGLRVGDILSAAPTNGRIESIVSTDLTSGRASLLNLQITSSDTPAAGFGGDINVLGKSTTTMRNLLGIISRWAAATDASRRSEVLFLTWDAAQQRIALHMSTSGSAPTIGFLGAGPAARQTLPAAATGAATTQSLANAIRSLLITFGLAQ